MSTQAEKFQKIANAIKSKTGKIRTSEDGTIKAEDFAKEIYCIDPFRPTTLYPEGLDNGYCGNLVAKVAASYHCARYAGLDVFDYDQYGSTNIFNTIEDTSAANYGKAQVRDSNGRGLLDCSSYIGLVLRGIGYDNSPFKDKKDADTWWCPSDEIDGYYGTTGWEFTILDKQPVGVWRDFGISGYSTPRSAGHIGDFFYKYGHVIYDQVRDGDVLADDESVLTELGEKVLSELKPGDILFMAAEDPVDFNYGHKRFRSISHIMIVAERTDRYFHVTGVDDNTEDEKTVLYSGFTVGAKKICLVCRPDYLRNCRLALENETDASKIKLLENLLAKEIPIGVNLLNYPWYFTSTEGYEDSNQIEDLTVQITGMSSLDISGSSEDGTSIYLKSGSTYLTLPAGTYKLSGMEDATGFTAAAKLGALQARINGDSWTNAESIFKCYSDASSEFELTEESKVYIRVVIAAGTTINGTITVTPTLEKIS